MFKLLVLLALVAYASAGGLYSSLGSYGYGSGYGYGYGLGGYGLGHGGSIVSYAPTYATSYANTYRPWSPVYYGSYYPSAKRILYSNPLNKLAYNYPTYLGGYAASYSPYSSYYKYGGYGLNDYDYGLGHGYGGYSGYGGYGLGGYGGYGLGYNSYYNSLGGVSAYGHNIYNHYN
ncbi:hypothetical protein TSAR_015386 [Trichomalopsis sarcophagae]|uniref:Uncharacterized protein n=1 Tax=Trichomalopsis sarcophagae TaxID=543379 RepID=A0A232EST3_9HYME|nr:hypothetical protein TSAR_015386 [Trichomalopsis sarcophagae]